MNLSCGVNETSFTENAFWINGKRTKVDLVSFTYNNPDNRWTIKSFDNKINLFFEPEKKYQEKADFLFIATDFKQFMGNFHGEVVEDTGSIVKIDNCPGWTEDHYVKW